jgi:hypothetical protein
VTAIIPPAAQGQAWRFGYDGRLNRTKIVKGGAATYYCWDGMNQLEERDASGNLVARYTHGVGPVYGVGSVVEVMRKRGATTYFQYLHMDHQGSVQAITNTNQATTHKYVADGFGRQIANTTGTGTAIPNELRFQSNWMDITVGTKRMGLSPSRTFDFELGNFRQVDKLPDWMKVVQGIGENRSNNPAASMGHFDVSLFAAEIRYQAQRSHHIISKYGPDYLVNLWDASGFDGGTYPGMRLGPNGWEYNSSGSEFSAPDLESTLDLIEGTLEVAMGAGDAITFGGTTLISQGAHSLFGNDEGVERIQRAKDCSNAFGAGQVLGEVLSAGAGAGLLAAKAAARSIAKQGREALKKAAREVANQLTDILPNDKRVGSLLESMVRDPSALNIYKELTEVAVDKHGMQAKRKVFLEKVTLLQELLVLAYTSSAGYTAVSGRSGDCPCE